MAEFDLLEQHTKGQQANSLAAYLPNDCTFAAAYREDTVLRNFLLGLGQQLLKFENTVNLYTNEIMLNGTHYLLPEFERMLSIPDECFDNTDSDEQRRRNIQVKLGNMNSQTVDEFETTAALLGFDVTVLPGYDAINPPNNLVIPEINNDTEARFSIVVLFDAGAAPGNQFPYTFDFQFGGADLGVMQCVLTKLKPANCQIIFIDEA